MVFTLKNREYGLFQFTEQQRQEESSCAQHPRLSWARCGVCSPRRPFPCMFIACRLCIILRYLQDYDFISLCFALCDDELLLCPSSIILFV